MFSRRGSYGFIRCANCGEQLEPRALSAAPSPAIRYGILKCSACGSEYPISDFVPQLLRDQYTGILTDLQVLRLKRSLNAAKDDLARATTWLEDTLALDVGELPPDPAGRRLLQYLAYALEVRAERGLTDTDLRELCSLLTSELVSIGYRRHVSDPLVASLEAVNCDKYEDILLRAVMNRCLGLGQQVMLIELGSGVGRVLHQYGSCMSDRWDAAVTYRRTAAQLYAARSLPNSDRLEAVLGVDFAPNMIGQSTRWLERDKLAPLVREGRIIHLLGTIRDTKLSFAEPPWNEMIRVVCVLFETLGEQLSRDLQVDVLRRARELASPQGIVFVSTFAAEQFAQEGHPYYDSLQAAIGPAWYWGKQLFLSTKGVHSSWFTESSLRELFAEAEMPNSIVLGGKSLRVFPEFEEIISLETQAYYRERMLVGVLSEGIDADVVGELAAAA